MPIEISVIRGGGETEKITTVPVGKTVLFKDIVGELVKIIAVRSPHGDAYGEIHVLDEDDVDIDDVRGSQVLPEDLLDEDTQVAIVFANTSYQRPSSSPHNDDVLLIKHTYSEPSLN